MEVKCFNDGLLTNIEVMELLKERRASRSAVESRLNVDSQHREYIEQKLLKYIESSGSGKLSMEAMQRCLARIKRLELGLSEAEMVQIANLLPQSEVELYLVIDNVSERLSGEEQASIMSLVSECLSSI